MPKEVDSSLSRARNPVFQAGLNLSASGLRFPRSLSYQASAIGSKLATLAQNNEKTSAKEV